MKGHIRQTGKNSLSVVVQVGKYQNGNPKYHWETIKRLRDEKGAWEPEAKWRKRAEKKLNDIINQVYKNNYFDAEKMTVVQYLSQWLEKDVLAPSAEKAYSTIKDYKYVCENYLEPFFKKTLLANLSPRHVRDLLNTVAAGPYTIRKVYRVLNTALNRAVEMEYIPRNPCPAARPKKPRKTDRPVLTLEQIFAFLQKANAAPNAERYYPVYLMALTTGMRLGEILGLRWKDVDLDKKVLYVRNTLKKPGPDPIFGAPKSQKSQRPILLTDIMVDELKKIEEAQKVEKKNAGDYYEDHGLVFAIAGGRPFNGMNITRRTLKTTLTRAGLPPMRFHDLRHTWASYLKEELDADTRKIADMLGHDEASTADKVYVHTSIKSQNPIIKKLNTRFKKLKN